MLYLDETAQPANSRLRRSVPGTEFLQCGLLPVSMSSHLRQRKLKGSSVNGALKTRTNQLELPELWSRAPARLTFGNFQIFSIISVALHVFGCLLCYSAAVSRNKVHLFLPLISHASGSPPETGIFTFFVTVSSFCGLAGAIFSFLGHDTCKQRLHQQLLQFLLNRASLLGNILMYVGWIGLTATPFGFTEVAHAYDWVCYVLLPHLAAALVAFGGTALLIVTSFTECLLLDGQGMFSYRAFIFYAILIAGYQSLHSLNELAKEEGFFENPGRMKSRTYRLPCNFSKHYVSSALCEWTLVTAGWLTTVALNKRRRLTVHLRMKRKQE